MDVFGLDGYGGRGRSRKPRRTRAKCARGNDMDIMEGGYYAPYRSRMGRKKSFQLGRKRMKDMGISANQRNLEQRDRTKHNARQVRYLFGVSAKEHPLQQHRAVRAKKGRQGNRDVLSTWRNFLEDFKNKHGWYLVKNGVRAYPKSYKQLLKDASRVWKNSKFNLN